MPISIDAMYLLLSKKKYSYNSSMKAMSYMTIVGLVFTLEIDLNQMGLLFQTKRYRLLISQAGTF